MIMSDGSGSIRTKGSIFEYFAPFISIVTGIVVLYASQFVVALGFAFFGFNYNKYQGTFDTIYAVIAILGLLLFSYVSRIFYKDFKAGILIKKPRVFEVFATVVIALGILGIVAVYITVVEDIATRLADKGSEVVAEQLEQYEESVDRYSDIAVDVVPDFDKVLNYISLAILIPIAEEILFRGIILGQLLKKYRPWVSILLSAAVFGVMHGLSVHIGYAFVCGIVIGAVYYATSNIAMTILIHIIFNFFGGTLSVILSDGLIISVSNAADDAIRRAASLVELFAITPAVVLLLVLLANKSNKDKKSNATDKIEADSDEVEKSVETV